MNTQITQGIKISVEVFYQPKYSQPDQDKFVFAYRVSIDNESNSTVQLMRRHWIIKDSTGITREVEGEGVIGKQPILQPGENHQYVSWAQLDSEIGKMYGTYEMANKSDDGTFRVSIPVFEMVVPYRLN